MKGIIGAIAGDIIGSVYEFHPIKTKEFSLFKKTLPNNQFIIFIVKTNSF